MSSLHNQLKDPPLQGSLADRTFPTDGASHEVRSGGSLQAYAQPDNLLGYWNTGTLLPSRKLPLLGVMSLCLAGEDFLSRLGRRARVAAASGPPRNLLETLEP